MASYFKHLLETFRSAFWPLPTAIAFVCFLAAEGSLRLDATLSIDFLGWSANASPEGLRSLLSTAASGAITLAALVFSTTLVALTLASSQFGPRLLHNFIRARTNQVTLGVLVGTFLFCLIALRSAHSESLPRLTAALAFALTLTSLALFLYFVHHLVRSLQAEQIVESVGKRLFAGIEKAFPKHEPSTPKEREAESERKGWSELENEMSVSCRRAGYLQFVDTAKLVELAQREDCRVRSIARPGELLLDDERLFAYERSEPLSHRAVSQFLECFIIGNQRTPEQDFEFEIRQLVEVGVRALSPGSNDPFTAESSIDLLAIALGRIAQRRLPNNEFRDSEGDARVRLPPVSFRRLLETAFLRLSHDSISRPDVLLRLGESLLLVGRRTRDRDQLDAVQEFAENLEAESNSGTRSRFHGDRLREIFEEIREIERD